MNNMTAVSYKIKTILIFILLCLWGLGAVFYVYKYSVMQRKILLKEARRIAWRESSIPAKRGSILDSNGKVLAHDEFRIALILESWGKPAKNSAFRKTLKKFDENYNPDPAKMTFPAVIKENLSPEEIVYCRKIFRSYPEVRVTGYFQRIVHPDAVEFVGRTAKNEREETVGISGLEQKYDLELSGRPGRLSVMLDKRKNWIPDTLRILRQPQNGQDYKLSQSIEELCHGK